MRLDWSAGAGGAASIPGTRSAWGTGARAGRRAGRVCGLREQGRARTWSRKQGKDGRKEKEGEKEKRKNKKGRRKEKKRGRKRKGGAGGIRGDGRPRAAVGDTQRDTRGEEKARRSGD